MRLLCCFLAACSSLVAFAAEGDARLLRFPDIYKDKIVFVSAGDLYVVPSAGGVARRLTSHEGRELFPKFSPDGSMIAFSAEYNGTRQVYVMPSEGGVPRQLTFYNDVGPMPPRGGFDNQVMDWSPDGKHILFRANRLPWGVRMGRFYTVPVDGGLEQPLAIPESGGGMFSPDGTKIVYTPISREWRTWKRTHGGRAQDVWVYDLERDEATRVTDHPLTDNLPMWVGKSLFFTSDREYTLNLFRCDPDGGNLTKVTNHGEWDVLWPSAGPTQIVYENAGGLRVFDSVSGNDREVSVQIVGAFEQTLAYRANVSEFIDGFEVSPSGKRAVFTARGDVFTVPVEHGPTRNLSRTSGVRERNPVWSPDGKWIAYLSDREGEYELFVRPAKGGEERRITTGLPMWPMAPTWSPDSEKLAVSSKDRKLYIVHVADGKMVEVAKGRYGDLLDHAWSPDSEWLVYTQVAENQFGVIWGFHLEPGEHHQLTSEHINNFNPAFSPDGNYLYFLSNRDYNLTFSGYEFSYMYTRPTRIYAATLNDSVARPFAPKSDEEEAKAAEPPKEEDDSAAKDRKKGKKKGRKKAEKAAESESEKPGLQVDGFESRVFVLDVGSGNYGALSANKAGVFFLERNQGGPATLRHFDMAKRKTETVLENVFGYRLSAKGDSLIYRSGNNYGIVKAQPKQKPKSLNLSKMEVKIEPRAEWRQIYHDAYLLMRDWFYDPDMHGYDWKALWDRYRPLVDHVKTRSELDFILGELGGELNAGHYYVNSGDEPRVERDNSGLLGAEMEADASGFYKVREILPGENWHQNFRSPLRDVGVNVSEGEFILAVDGVNVRTDTNFYATLEGKGDQEVTLTVNDKPSTEGAREVVVRTITRETNLRYLKWVRERQAKVDELSGGRIGYIHVPNTAFEGNRELFKHFYAQMHKDALVLDDRYNGGGFIPFHMIELLGRPVLSYWAQRDIEPFRSPGYAHVGPKAVLTNGYSSSGGDAFPYYMRKQGLAKLYGTRTWGGLIGLQGNPAFLDGGSLSIPVFRFVDPDTGQWAVENEGVSPDVEVVDRPDLIAKGQDPTLEAAVEALLKELEKNPPKKIQMPDPPNESKRPPRR